MSMHFESKTISFIRNPPGPPKPGTYKTSNLGSKMHRINRHLINQRQKLLWGAGIIDRESKCARMLHSGYLV